MIGSNIIVTKINDYYKVLTPNDDLNTLLELNISHFEKDKNFTVCLDGHFHKIIFVLHDDHVSIKYGHMFIRLSYINYPVFTNRLLNEYIDNADDLYLRYRIATHDHCTISTNIVILGGPTLDTILIVDNKIRFMCSMYVSIAVPWLKVKDISSIICKLYLLFQKDVSVVSYMLGCKYDGLYTNSYGTKMAVFTYKGNNYYDYKKLLENRLL